MRTDPSSIVKYVNVGFLSFGEMKYDQLVFDMCRNFFIYDFWKVYFRDEVYVTAAHVTPSTRLVQGSNEELQVFGDAFKLHQIFHNLIGAQINKGFKKIIWISRFVQFVVTIVRNDVIFIETPRSTIGFALQIQYGLVL